MTKKDVFEKNKNLLIKKASVYIIAMVTIAGTFIPIVNSYPVDVCDPIINLPPDPVTAKIIETWDDSYLKTTLSNVPSGYDVADGTYSGWCVDFLTPFPFGSFEQVRLYSSYCPPTHLEHENWSKVNYVLNHKLSTNPHAILDAIFYLVNFGSVHTAMRLGAWDMVNDAIANGEGFVPGPDEVIAVIGEHVNNSDNNRIQYTITEVSMSEDNKPEDQYNLTINIVGNGSVAKDPDQTTYTCGTLVELTATADPGWTFANWSGDLSGSANPATINMTGNRTVNATFTEDQYTLTINYEGNGAVTTNPDQPTYMYGILVNLTATADPGWIFNHWSGDLSGSENPENITMDDNKIVIANFTEIEDEDEDDEEDNEEDNDDHSSTTVTITISSNSYAGNSPPVANTSGPYYGVIDEEIEFDGSKSYDLDGIITHYGWSFGDGNTGFSEVMTHNYSNGGSYLVTLMVIDDDGTSDINKTIAFISVPNRPPSIPKILGPPTGSKDTKYSYATGSTDLDNDEINYIIDWGDGTTNESGFLPSGHYFSMLHSWAEPGEYNITVTASDDQSTSSSEMTVHIEENILADNIVIVILGILVLIALLISLLYIKKGKKK